MFIDGIVEATGEEFYQFRLKGGDTSIAASPKANVFLLRSYLRYERSSKLPSLIVIQFNFILLTIQTALESLI